MIKGVVNMEFGKHYRRSWLRMENIPELFLVLTVHTAGE